MTQAASQGESKQQAAAGEQKQNRVIQPGEPSKLATVRGFQPYRKTSQTPVGGRIPVIGDQVWLWYVGENTDPDRQSVRPVPAILYEEDRRHAGAWHVFMFRSAGQRLKRGVLYSDTPKLGYWSWRVDPNVPVPETGKEVKP